MSQPAPPSQKTRIDLRDERSWRLMRRLLDEAVRPYAGRLVLALGFMALVAGTTALSAWLMDPVVNKVFVQQDAGLLWLVGGAVVATFVVKSVASYAQETLIAYVGQRVVADTQRRLFRHLLGQDVALFQERASGTLISHFTYDINAMRVAVSNALVGLGRDVLSVVFLAGVMVWQEWLLALITLVILPLSVYPIQCIGKRMRRVSAETQEEMAELTATLSQSFQGIRLVKAYRLEAHQEGQAVGLIDRIFRLTYRAARVRAAAQPIIDALGGIAIAAVIVYGGARVIDGTTTPGAFFSFITAALMAYQPLRALSKINANLQEGLAAAQRVFAVLDRRPVVAEPTAPVAVPREPGPVALEDVRFSYDGVANALDGVRFEAPAGQVTALVGPSGAGKSTVLGLVPRFFDPDSGVVRVNGVDARAASLAGLRDAIALVGQEVVLFDDTVMNNIRCGRLDADDAAVVAAAEAANADGFIRELPDGYRTRIGEHGMRLSGGQRQRLAIARALLKDAPILLLDEATSALDTESERHIQAALKRLMTGRTTLVIAHRLSTIVDADLIYVFEGGRVVERGTHAELIGREGRYARLHALQFTAEPAAAAGR